MATVPARILLPALLLGACTFHSTATHWNGRVGADGRPVFLVTTWKYGFNLFGLLPFVGDIRVDQLVDESTARIAATGSDRLRIVETEYLNYWYVLPPLTWFVSPMYGSVSIEYEPSAQELASARAADALFEQRARARQDEDHRHLVPEPRR